MPILFRNRKIAPEPSHASANVPFFDPSRHVFRSNINVADRKGSPKGPSKGLNRLLSPLTTEFLRQYKKEGNSSSGSTGTSGSRGTGTGTGSSSGSSSSRNRDRVNKDYIEMATLVSSTRNNRVRAQIIRHKIQLPTIGFFNSTLIAYLIGELQLLKRDKPAEEKALILNNYTSNINTVYFNDKCFSSLYPYSTTIKFLAAAFLNSKKSIDTIVLEKITLTSELLAVFSLLHNTNGLAYQIKKLILRDIVIPSYDIFAELMNVIKSMRNISLLDFTGLTFTLPANLMEKCVVLFIKDMVENLSTLHYLNIQKNTGFDTILAKYFSDEPIDKFSIIGITDHSYYLQIIDSKHKSKGSDNMTLKFFIYKNGKIVKKIVKKSQQINFHNFVNKEIEKEVSETYKKAVSTDTTGGRKKKIYAKAKTTKTAKTAKK
jgi:hypothetical protein